MPHSTWKAFFAARVENEIGNKNTSVYTEAWSPDKNDNMRFQSLISDPDNVLLATDSDNMIHTLHSFKVVGGTLLRPTAKLICLLGSGPHATAVLVDKQSILNPCDLKTPTIDELKDCSNEEEVRAIPAPVEDGLVTYPGLATFLPAPWLVDTIMSTNTSEASKLIPAVNAAAFEFDAEHENDPEYITNAAAHAGDFILWAWGVMTGRVSKSRLSMDPNDPDLTRHYDERHQNCLSRVQFNIPDGLPPVQLPPNGPAVDQALLGMLNATVNRQVDGQEQHNIILEKQLRVMEEREISTKNRVKNLHESTLKMILFASAMDNESVPTEPIDSCRRIINSKTVALAEQELNLQFENRDMLDVSFPSGYTANVYLGIFNWSSADTPSNHSPFSFSEVEPIRMDEQKNRHLLLQLVLTQGKGMTVDEIKASNKQEVKAPTNIHDMMVQLKMFTVANDIFFGELSVGSQCLRALQTMIERQRPVFKAKENLDEEFASKFLLAVDTRFQMWLKQCRIARIRSDVDDSIIDFAHLVSQVLFGSFHITLPPTFKMKAPIDDSASNNDTKKHDGNDDGKGDKGKKKKKGDEAREMVQNKAPHPDLCMLSTETWAINFANKNVNSRPKFNDKSVMCPRWLLQKYCFNNCKHKDSHVKADKIPADKVTAMKEWIKSCRSNGN